ncbi:hypothetical protein GOBAR_AA18885 [Gossypium barbadense]|uniref:Glutamine amidotransferase domain-containing protein n=1 Tax=Gossypium barbadense TaxID=3634 RepID=A0A2P5XEL6_GOSBA|nr:hypothetical protein GOBAR_AA18885 [Gossypium barbadense]
MEGVAFASFTSFATKSLLFSSLSPYSIITHRQKSQKNTLKTISPRNLVIRASSASSSGSVVTLLDYGAGNVRSLRNAIRYLGFEIEDVRTPKDILNADRLIIPGVGAFASAMDVLVKTGCWSFCIEKVLTSKFAGDKVQSPTQGEASKLAKRVIACLDVRTNDKGDLVVTKGDQYDVREQTKENEVRNLGKPVELSGQYYKDGADEVSFLSITGFRDFPLGDLPMLQGTREDLRGKTIRTNDKGDLVVTKGDQYDVREQTKENEVLRHASQNVFVPLTVGGGIRDFTDSNGVKTGKSSLEQISRVYGNQAVVVSIDPRRVYYSSLEVASEYFRSGADKISIGSDAVYAAEEYLKTKVGSFTSLGLVAYRS